MPSWRTVVVLLIPLLSVSSIMASFEPDSCPREDEDEPYFDEKLFKLTRLDGKEVNHTWTVHVDKWSPLTLRTISMNPQIIEIPHFLSEAECQHIQEAAIRAGLKSSKTLYRFSEQRQFVVFDLDEDGRITLDEMKLTLEMTFDVVLDPEEIRRMYVQLKLDEDGDGVVSRQEIIGLSPVELYSFALNYKAGKPEKMNRYSESVLLSMTNRSDEILKRIQIRFSQLVQLPLQLIRLGELQVVKYEVKGHYNGHLDCTPEGPSLPCCLRGKKRVCRLCRYLTGMLYLNNVEKGGETAFPNAQGHDENDEEPTFPPIFDLYKDCAKSRMLIAPERGKAVLWYNFFLDSDTGWMGEADELTYHGGCQVQAGVKWIANFWVHLSDDREKTVRLMTNRCS